MKRIFFIVAALLLFLSSFAQRTDEEDAYYKRSQDQRTAGYITLGCGAATLLPGLFILGQTEPGLENLDKGLKGAALAAVGVACIGASVILFIKANKNEKHARRASLQFNKPVVINTGFQKTFLPYSVGLAIPLN